MPLKNQPNPIENQRNGPIGDRRISASIKPRTVENSIDHTNRLSVMLKPFKMVGAMSPTKFQSIP